MVWTPLFILILAGLAYIRLAPTDVARHHRPVKGDADADGAGSCLRVRACEPDGLARFDAAMMALPRTQRLAGSVADGRITYVTRSKWIGFPDYTTVEARDGALAVYGRLRFGRSDFGVNRARVDAVLTTLEKA